MKTFFKHILVLILTSFCLVSCEDLTKQIDDFEPLYQLPFEDGITDELSSELALIGVYSKFAFTSGDAGVGADIVYIPARMSGISKASPFGVLNNPERTGYLENNPSVLNTTISEGIYSNLYGIVNRANWIIEVVPSISIDNFQNPNRKTEIVAEAKIMRALAHFYLLRLYGQYYDNNSSYGIDVRIAPARSLEAFPRKTVSETYTQILQDLDDGIANGPALGTRNRWYATSNFAKAFKAKVLLNQGIDYDLAATLAEEVINSGAYAFSTYSELFDNTSDAMYNNSEILFGIREDQPNSRLLFNGWAIFVPLSDEYLNLATSSMNVGGTTVAYDNDRITSQTLGISLGRVANLKYRNSNSVSPGDAFQMIHFMRLPEVYYILAEADARANGNITSRALDALNTVRMARGAVAGAANNFIPYPNSFSSLDQFLQAVRIDKMVELSGEVGEEWYDMVRFDYADGFGTGYQVSDFKPTATNPDKFILPIPPVTIESGNDVIEQNPSY